MILSDSVPLIKKMCVYDKLFCFTGYGDKPKSSPVTNDARFKLRYEHDFIEWWYGPTGADPCSSLPDQLEYGSYHPDTFSTTTWCQLKVIPVPYCHTQKV